MVRSGFPPCWRRFCALVLAVVLAGTPAVRAADDLPDLGESSRAELSPQLERRIGESIMNEIRLREPTYVDDPDINDYLGRLGRRLVEASANPTGEFHFFAVRDSAINAFAMFGGYIGVNTGTILVAQTESELAGVMAHEIGHVTQNHLARQIAKQKQNTVPAMIAMAVALLVARSNADLAMASVSAAQAGIVQSQLAYSRDFEREADRAGFQTLDKAGFDVRGMGDFFSRMQQAGRLYDNSVPVYLRSHPLTVERLSDMENRAQNSPYRQVVSSLEFFLVRAKVRAQMGAARDAVAEFQGQLREHKYSSQAAARYGLAVALMRAKDAAAADREIEALQALKLYSPMISSLAAEVKMALGNPSAAQAIYLDGMQRFPSSKALIYGYADSLHAARKYAELQSFLTTQLQNDSLDYKLHGLQAKAFAAQGKRLQQHRAQAEYYYLQGQLGPAIEQLQFAQQASDGNFYEQSAVDARLRELRRQQIEEDKLKRSGG